MYSLGVGSYPLFPFGAHEIPVCIEDCVAFVENHFFCKVFYLLI